MTQKPLEITDISSSSLDENGLQHVELEENKKTASATENMRSYHDDDVQEPASAFVAMSSSDDEVEEMEDEPVLRNGSNGNDDDDDHADATPAQQQHHQHHHHHHDGGDDHKTTVWQTFVHLVKGYIGPGCLSLPWAMSQLGIIPGVVICFALAAWSSYNCWIVVKLKRRLMTSGRTAPGGRQLTYPDVAGCMYGPRAQSVTALSIGTQQLAICTVFFSFCGDNLQAVLNGLIRKHVDEEHPGFSHAAVITFCFPVVLALAMIPDLKGLASASAFGTLLLVVGFAILGVLVLQEYEDRPGYVPETGFPYFNTSTVSLYPLATCALLYSYEGICLILPIESAMKKPEHFGWTFTVAMFLAAMTFSTVAGVAVYVFGSVSDGSLTAFLLERYEVNGASEELVILLWTANAAVSLSVLVTFPLQLFPALELVQEALDGARRVRRGGRGGGRFAPVQTDAEEEDEEGGRSTVTSVSDQQNGVHEAESNGVAPSFDIGDENGDDEVVDDEHKGTRNHRDPGIHVGVEEDNSVPDSETEHFSDEPVSNTHAAADETDDEPTSSFSSSNLLLRIGLVLFTYVIAIVVPNVQSLIALAGALAGSLTALILPPALALADDGRTMTVMSLVLGSIFGLVGTAAALWGIVKEK